MNLKVVLLAASGVVFAVGSQVPAHAQKEVFVREKPHVNIGTIGHVDEPGPNALQTNSPDGSNTIETEPATAEIEECLLDPKVVCAPEPADQPRD